MFMFGLGFTPFARLRFNAVKKKCAQGLGELSTRTFHGKTINYATMPYKDGTRTYTQVLNKYGLLDFERIKTQTSRYEATQKGVALRSIFSKIL